MSSYTPYAVSESSAVPPKWRPGEDLAASGFLALIFFLVIDVNFGIYRTFKRRKGLYYWSMILGIWGVTVSTLGLVFKLFKPDWDHIWPLEGVLIVFGWSFYAPAELLVLYSRLHLVNRSHKVQHYVLIFLLSGSFALIVPNLIFIWPAYDIDPKVSSLWSPRMDIMSRIDQIGFTLIESVLSGIYIWSLVNLLRVKSTVRQRRVMLDLIYVNIIAISLDLLEVIMVWLNQLGMALPIQAFSYALKLKLEFTVLNQLMAIAARGIQRESFEERRYHHSVPSDYQTEDMPLKELSKDSPKSREIPSQSQAEITVPAPVVSTSRDASDPSLDVNSKDHGAHDGRAPVLRSFRHPFGQQLDRQGSDSKEILPVAGKVTRPTPPKERKHGRDQGEELEEEEIGVHMWENRGKLVMEVPWFKTKLDI